MSVIHCYKSLIRSIVIINSGNSELTHPVVCLQSQHGADFEIMPVCKRLGDQQLPVFKSFPRIVRLSFLELKSGMVSLTDSGGYEMICLSVLTDLNLPVKIYVRNFIERSDFFQQVL
jgi:hypothetical protein